MGEKECLACDGGLWFKRLSEEVLGERHVVLYRGLVLECWRAGFGGGISYRRVDSLDQQIHWGFFVGRIRQHDR